MVLDVIRVRGEGYRNVLGAKNVEPGATSESMERLSNDVERLQIAK